MSFHIGQKIVCVDPIGVLVKGHTYTIAAFNTSCGCHQGKVVLREFPESFPPCAVCGGPTERGYRPSRFRPIENLTASLARTESERIVEERPDHVSVPQTLEP